MGVLKEKFDGEQEVADKEFGRVADEGPGTDADKEGPGRDGGSSSVLALLQDLNHSASGQMIVPRTGLPRLLSLHISSPP